MMKLDVKASNPDLESLWDVLPLHDGTVLVCNKKGGKLHVIRLSDQGVVIRNLITTDKDITGFILMSEIECLVLYKDGSLQTVRIEDGEILGSEKQVPDVKWLYDGLKVDDEKVLLVDRGKGEIFTYELKNGKKDVVIDKLNHPSSIDKAVTNQGVVYIVSVWGADEVHVYSDTWRMVRSIKVGSGQGRGDGLHYSDTARVLPDNTFIVSDTGNHRVSCFTIDGDFKGHVLEESHGIRRPRKLTVQYPNVWVSYGDSPYNIKCYQIYR